MDGQEVRLFVGESLQPADNLFGETQGEGRDLLKQAEVNFRQRFTAVGAPHHGFDVGGQHLLLYLVGADALIAHQNMDACQDLVGLAQQRRAVRGQGLVMSLCLQCLLSKAGRRDGSTLSRHGWREEAAFFRFEAEIPAIRSQRGLFVGKRE